jgi:hypothetical protein
MMESASQSIEDLTDTDAAPKAIEILIKSTHPDKPDRKEDEAHTARLADYYDFNKSLPRDLDAEEALDQALLPDEGSVTDPVIDPMSEELL